MSLVHGFVCKRCNKIYGYEHEKKVYIKCHNKKIDIGIKEVIKIQHYNFKCPKCNKKVNCYYTERVCPYCGEINVKEKCYKKPKGKPKFVDINKGRKY